MADRQPRRIDQLQVPALSGEIFDSGEKRAKLVRTSAVSLPTAGREKLAHLRRAKMRVPDATEDTVAGGPVVLDVARHEVLVRGGAVAFPPKEFELLETLLRRKGRLLTRDFLIEEIWGADYVGDTKTLDVHVKRLRSKVETDPARPTRILTQPLLQRDPPFQLRRPGRLARRCPQSPDQTDAAWTAAPSPLDTARRSAFSSSPSIFTTVWRSVIVSPLKTLAPLCNSGCPVAT